MNDNEQFLRLGREVVRMIRDLRKVNAADTGYARRKFTFPGGAVFLFVVNDERLADFFDQAVQLNYEVSNAIPPSAKN